MRRRPPPPRRRTSIRVEPGATELRVQVVSANQRTNSVRLRAPDGSLPNPTASRPQTTTYAIDHPRPGLWDFTGAGGSPTPKDSVLLHAALRSRVTLFSAVDVEHSSQLPTDGFDDPAVAGDWVGSDLVLAALPYENRAVRGCQVEAIVRKPNGQERTIVLRDDGMHTDRGPDDGVYGARFTETALAGLYWVRVRAACISAVSGSPFLREARRSVTLREASDRDGDRIPDYWETRFGLDPEDASDAGADADEDGLTAAEEFARGTWPGRSDSDGGGEDDASEIASGRDPRDRTDDAVGAPSPWVKAGNARVLVGYGARADGLDLELQRAPSATGPWSLGGTFTAGSERTLVDDGVFNDIETCYRLRWTHPGGERTAWSSVSCVTPREDPDPPLAAPMGARIDPELREVEVRLSLDDRRTYLAYLGGLDLGTVPSGTAELRVANNPWMDGAVWLPVAGSASYEDEDGVFVAWEHGKLTVTFPEALDRVVLWVEATDAAGNLSLPRAIPVSLGTGG